MAGYVKVANEVFRCFRKPARLAVAVRLYELGDMHRWEPFSASDRFLMDSGPTRRDVEAVLCALEDMGLLAITSRGTRINPRRVHVFNPSEKTEHHVEHHASRKYPAPTEPLKETGAHVGAHVGAKYQTTDKTTETPIPPEGLLRVLSALKGKPIESASRMAPKQLKNFRAKTGATVDELVLVAEAMHRCPAPLFARDVRAEGWPEGSDRRKQLGTLLCQRRWDDRLSAAQEWRAKPVRPVREVEPESVRAQRENLRRLRAERGGK